MKILLVTWYFPPSHTIAAVRLGKLARYLNSQGHELRVLTPQDPPLKQGLQVDIPAELVLRTPWQAEQTPAASNGAKSGAAQSAPPANQGQPSKLKRLVWRIHASFSDFPDARISWFPFAVQAGTKLLQEWRPDLIYASGPPFTTLLIGEKLSRKFGIPLAIEFRDRWSDEPYSPPLFWRRWQNRRAERAVVDQATAIITVSEPWQATYEARFHKPTAVVYNGYDAELCAEGPFDGAADKQGLEIVYTGGIYPGYRDPSPLFAAMRKLEQAGVTCRMVFHGVRAAVIEPLAKAQGVSHLVDVGEVLSHEAALQRQRSSDILVLLQWNNPKEQGNVPGKFFEYLGARRPILVLGLREGVPATIVRERQAGFFSNDPDEIAQQLKAWYQVKREKGHLPPVPESGRAGFARDDQYARLESFLQKLQERPGIGKK